MRRNRRGPGAGASPILCLCFAYFSHSDHFIHHKFQLPIQNGGVRRIWNLFYRVEDAFLIKSMFTSFHANERKHNFFIRESAGGETNSAKKVLNFRKKGSYLINCYLQRNFDDSIVFLRLFPSEIGSFMFKFGSFRPKIEPQLIMSGLTKSCFLLYFDMVFKTAFWLFNCLLQKNQGRQRKNFFWR